MKTFMRYAANSLEIICCWQHMLPRFLDDFIQEACIKLLGTHCIFFEFAIRIDEKYDVWEWQKTKIDCWPDYPS